MAGDTGWRGGAGAVIKQVLIMRDEGAFESGLDWVHFLGVSQPKWAVSGFGDTARLACSVQPQSASKLRQCKPKHP